MKKINILIIALLLLSQVFADKGNGKLIRTVVIDAGHGGIDPGCVGKKAKEKDIALSISLMIGKKIQSSFPDVKVIYTRRDDRFIELYQRADIANKHKADLFISVHCNANKSTKPFGSETYVMGLHKTEANLAIAKKENASILLEDDYKAKYEGFDPNSIEAYIIFSLYQNMHLEKSLNLATKIQKYMKNAGRFDRGVKQAGFLVIWKTTMPSLLFEVGFLSNPMEELYLISDRGQETIANSVFNAFKEYKYEAEGTKMIEPIVIKKDTSNTIAVNDKVKAKDTVIEKPNPEEKIENPDKDKIIYKVQFATSPVKKDVNSFKLNNVDFYIDKNTYKYTSGKEYEITKVRTLLNEIKSSGYKDAFIVQFKNGQRIN